MKKILALLVGILGFVFATNVKALDLPEVTDHEKVTIYVFRGHGCSHCYDALSYLYANASKYSDYLEVKAYEVWYNENNGNLMTTIASDFDDLDDGKIGVPYILVGSSYHAAGFGSLTGEKIISAALSEYQNSKYVDIVKKTLKSEKITASEETLEEACQEEGITEETIKTTENKSGKYDALIIAGIFVVIIGGVVALVLTNRHD